MPTESQPVTRMPTRQHHCGEAGDAYYSGTRNDGDYEQLSGYGSDGPEVKDWSVEEVRFTPRMRVGVMSVLLHPVYGMQREYPESQQEQGQ